MVRLTETTKEDVPQIAEWLAADPWHAENKRNDPNAMVTGNNNLLAYCVQDDEGPVAYFLLTADAKILGHIRVAVQFAPESEVSKRRVARGLTEAGMPAMILFAQSLPWCRGLIYESESPTLIKFVEKFGFINIGDNEFVLPLEDQPYV